VVAVALGGAIKFGLLDASRLLPLTALVFLPVSRLRPRLRWLLPAPVLICFANFVLLTVVFYGLPRFTEVTAFLVILTAGSVAVWCGIEVVRYLGTRTERAAA
jgi:hypothetical protein